MERQLVDIYQTLTEYTNNIIIYNPLANKDVVNQERCIECIADKEIVKKQKYDAIIFAVAHKQFEGINFREMLTENGVIYDVKGVLPREHVDARLQLNNLFNTDLCPIEPDKCRV